MRIAVAGKGGTGKTTIVGMLGRLFGRRGRSVLALDVDSNPNLAITLALPRDTAAHIQAALIRWVSGVPAMKDTPTFT